MTQRASVQEGEVTRAAGASILAAEDQQRGKEEASPMSPAQSPLRTFVCLWFLPGNQETEVCQTAAGARALPQVPLDVTVVFPKQVSEPA